MTARDTTTFVLGVDGGNSKTDVALVAADGGLLAARRTGTVSHQQVGLEPGAARLVEVVDAARVQAGLGEGRLAEEAVYSLAGADTPGDLRRLTAAFAARPLARSGHVLNDSFAPVRAGSEPGLGRRDHLWRRGQCGRHRTGRADRTVRRPRQHLRRLGWGWRRRDDRAGAAVRARDGRGPRTALERLVPAHFGLHRPLDVTNALEHHQISYEELRHLSPVIFQAAAEDDAVARGIVDRLADELAVMGNSIIRRLHLVRRDVDVILAGGVFEANDADFEARIADRIHAVSPAAQVARLRSLPVAGAALLALDRLLGSRPATRIPSPGRPP